jgi:uncharacterized protein YajQ (UPF0234 family)
VGRARAGSETLPPSFNLRSKINGKELGACFSRAWKAIAGAKLHFRQQESQCAEEYAISGSAGRVLSSVHEILCYRLAAEYIKQPKAIKDKSVVIPYGILLKNG